MTTQIRLSRPSRFSAFKAIILCLLAGAACISFIGCGGDTESSTSPIGEITSSSSDEVIESSDGYAFLLTSSSEQGSSSSITPNESSSSVQSSSSEVAAVSSSSDVVAESSSSDKAESSSSEKSSSSMAESSSSVECSSSEVPSSSSVIESSSSVVESSSSDGIFDSSSSESIVSSSSVMESSSSDMIVGKCKTSTEDKCVYGELYDERDGKTYKTVFMGTQEWMAEYLNYADSIAAPNLQENTWCYNNDDSNCDKYGRLYSWYAAMDIPKESCSTNTTSCPIYHNHRGICPNGWHLPDTADFAELLKYVKKYSPTKYGYDLVATSETNGSDAFGYSILYGGYFYSIIKNPIFNGIGAFANLWTSTLVTNSNIPEEIRAYMMKFQGQDVYHTASHVKIGESVRCIKDN